ncbi:hypothetical protein CEXT_591011 [Caerostris extrusa]|uniref:Uncharacterized protein n=1 Tax=Caerostris extrusa TaxID=172846 RepID=A0AAV4SKJ6_CAEEX|nr:hypothetical protein CEXT_591011 [Caerostris extrusa]
MRNTDIYGSSSSCSSPSNPSEGSSVLRIYNLISRSSNNSDSLLDWSTCSKFSFTKSEHRGTIYTTPILSQRHFEEVCVRRTSMDPRPLILSPPIQQKGLLSYRFRMSTSGTDAGSFELALIQ